MIPLSVQVQVNDNEENDEEEDDDDNCVLIRYNEFLEVYKKTFEKSVCKRWANKIILKC